MLSPGLLVSAVVAFGIRLTEEDSEITTPKVPGTFFGFVSFNPVWALHGFPGGDMGLISLHLLTAEQSSPGLPMGTVVGIGTGFPVGVTLVASLGFSLFFGKTGRC